MYLHTHIYVYKTTHTSLTGPISEVKKRSAPRCSPARKNKTSSLEVLFEVSLGGEVLFGVSWGGGLRTHVSQVPRGPSFCREDGRAAKGPAQPTKDGRIATESCCEDGRPRAHPAQPAMPFPSGRAMGPRAIDAGGGSYTSGRPEGPAHARTLKQAGSPRAQPRLQQHQTRACSR